MSAASGGDLAGLVALLDPEVVLTSDGGGVVSAARRPVQGPDRVARFLAGVSRKNADAVFLPALVNGRLGLVGLVDDTRGCAGGRALGTRRRFVMSFTVDAGLVTRVDIVMAPAKLGR